MTSSSLLNGDVSEMAASGINCATGGASGQRLDASQRVKIVIAEIAIGAQRDGRQIGEFSRWFLSWWTYGSTIVGITRRSTILRTVISTSDTSCIDDGTLVLLLFGQQYL
jgi:hypothetical protein